MGLGLALLLAGCVPNPLADEARVRQMVDAHFGSRLTPLDTGPVVVSGDYAVADWTKGDSGGRALFGRHEGTWMLLLCSGDSLRDGQTLRRAGVPGYSADLLARQLVDAERALPPARLRLMRSFARKQGFGTGGTV